jgi:hypothetical protein
MRSAPAVDVLLAVGRAERAVMASLSGLAWAVGGQWLAQHGGASGGVGLLAGALVGLAAGVPVARRLLPARAQRRLRWTGAAWQLGASEQPLQVDVQIDAGAWLLLRWQTGAPVRGPAAAVAAAVPSDRSAASGWLVARRGVAPQAWHGLRVALQAHAGQPPQAASPVWP